MGLPPVRKLYRAGVSRPETARRLHIGRIGRLLAELGFEGVELTRRSQDDGIDVRGTLVVSNEIRTQMTVRVECASGAPPDGRHPRSTGASCGT